VTTAATPEHQSRSHLDSRVRHAWATYREHLVDLDGVAYDLAERAEWEHLQVELREIATERLGPPSV
jgi:hypothetical protein